MNRMTVIINRSEDSNIALESFVAFEMRFERAVNAIKIILFKWCICQMMHSLTSFHQIVVHFLLTFKPDLLMRSQIDSCSLSYKISISILTACIPSRFHLIGKSCFLAMTVETIIATSIIERFSMIIILLFN